MNAPRARLFLWLGVTTAVCLVTWLAADSLLPFAIGALISYALAPVVEAVIRFIPIWNPDYAAWRRGIAVFVVYLVFFGGIVLAGFVLIPVAAEQIAHFIDSTPSIMASIRDQSLGVIAEYQRRTPPEIQERVARIAEQGASTVATLVGQTIQGTLQTVTATIGFVFGFAVLPFWMFYVMRDRRSVTGNIVQAAPIEVREDVRLMLTLLDRMLGRYLRAQLFLGLVIGIAVGVSMALFGVDLSLGLGVWAGVTELIPIIGPWLGAIPGLIIVAATNPSLLPWVALTYFMIQQLENNLLVPRIQGEAVDIHPAMVILVLVAGGAVWGFIGLVIAVPAAAMLRELFWYLDRRLRGRTPGEAFGESRLADQPVTSRLLVEESPAPDPVEVAR
ncbi:MAG: AI-2E family transporter [Chloroflexota bacterium]